MCDKILLRWILVAPPGYRSWEMPCWYINRSEWVGYTPIRLTRNNAFGQVHSGVFQPHVRYVFTNWPNWCRKAAILFLLLGISNHHQIGVFFSTACTISNKTIKWPVMGKAFPCDDIIMLVQMMVSYPVKIELEDVIYHQCFYMQGSFWRAGDV